jgi:hypothetical protein
VAGNMYVYARGSRWAFMRDQVVISAAVSG